MAGNSLDFQDFIEKRTSDFTGREWLFKEIDSWLAQEGGPRYFILSGEPGSGKSTAVARYSQLKVLDGLHFCIAGRSDTLDPLEFTRSLSIQLSRLDGFAAALLEDQGVHVDVDINIQENYGTVIGINIEKLLIKSRQPQKVFNQIVLLPLKALYEGGYAKNLLVLVDGLDESEQFGGSDPIYELLTGLEGLDGKVRFLLTARSRSRAERRFDEMPARRVKLDTAGGNRTDIDDFIQAKYHASTLLEDRLITTGTSLPDFIKILREKHQDNFRYLSLLFAALESGEEWVNDLNSLPAGLDGIYREHLRTRALGKNVILWRSYRPVLGVLAAAGEPLTAQQVEIFSGQDAQMVGDVLLDAGEFLDEQPGEPPRYSLYHRSLSDFLGDRTKAGNEFWIDLKAMHVKIAGVYEPAITAKSWQKIDAYGLEHVARHLFAGGAYDQLAGLIQPGWMQVRFKKDGYRYSGFLGDTDLAWQAAEYQDAMRVQQGKPILNWVVQVRCALVEASIRSIAASVPPGLLVRFVEAGIWTPERAIGLAAQTPELQMRINSLCALLNGGRLAPGQAAEVVRLLEDNKADPACVPSPVITGQIPGLPFAADKLTSSQRTQLNKALKRVLKRKDDYVEWLPSIGSKPTTFMSELSQILAPDDLPEVERRSYLISQFGIQPSVVAQTVRRNEWAAALSLALGLAPPSGKSLRILQSALEKVEAIHHPVFYSLGLWALAPFIPGSMQARFLDLTLSLPAGEMRVMILDRLAPALTLEALHKAADAMITVREDYLASIKFLTALAKESGSAERSRLAAQYAFDHIDRLDASERESCWLLLAELGELLPGELLDAMVKQMPGRPSSINIRAYGWLLPDMDAQRRFELAKELIRRPYELEMEGYLAPTYLRVWPYLDRDDQVHYLELLRINDASVRQQILDNRQSEAKQADWEEAIVSALLELSFTLRDDLLPCLESLVPWMKPAHVQRALVLVRDLFDPLIRLNAELLLSPLIPDAERGPVVEKNLAEMRNLPQEQAEDLLPALARALPNELLASAAWAMGILSKSLRSAPENGRGAVLHCLGELAPVWALMAGEGTLAAVYDAVTDLDRSWEWT